MVGCVMFHVVTGGVDGFLTKHFTNPSRKLKNTASVGLESIAVGGGAISPGPDRGLFQDKMIH